MATNTPPPVPPGGPLGQIDTFARMPRAHSELPPGICRFCGCVESKACAGGCAWTDDTETLCTACLAGAAIAADLASALGIAAAKPANGIHVARARWDQLDLPAQRVLVLQCREVLARIERHVEADLDNDAAEAIETVDALAAFLLEHWPDELQAASGSVAAAVVKLLGPQIGKRVILASGL